jgi:hypothetical protein
MHEYQVREHGEGRVVQSARADLGPADILELLGDLFRDFQARDV